MTSEAAVEALTKAVKGAAQLRHHQQRAAAGLGDWKQWLNLSTVRGGGLAELEAATCM